MRLINILILFFACALSIAQDNLDSQDFQTIQSLFSKSDFNGVIGKAQNFEKTYPKSKDLAQVQNLMGLSYLLTKRPQPAIVVLKKSLLSNTNSSLTPYIQFNLGAAQFDAGQVDGAIATLENLSFDALEKDILYKYRTLKARAYQEKKKYFEASREILLQSEKTDKKETAATHRGQLDRLVAQFNELAQFDLLIQQHNNSPLLDILLFRAAQLAEKTGKPRSAESLLKRIVSDFSESPFFPQAVDLIKTLPSAAEMDSLAVGVLVPLTGKFAKFGQRTLQAIELAFRIYNPSEADSKVTLHVADSGDDTEKALAGLKELVSDHHVAAVIGPLMSKGIDQVAALAQNLGVPLLSLAQQSVNQPGNFVFQFGLTAQLQAYTIAKYAIDELKIKRFAILFPRDKFGEQYSQAFWDAVESLGGEIKGFEAYSPEDTDFRQVIDKLIGTYYTDARQREVDVLAEYRKTNNIKRKNRKTEMYFNLPPIVDFDAVFVPDEPKVIGQILPTFAYRDANQVKFLGTATWNSSELITRGQSYVEGSLFTDAFFSESSSSAVKKFTQKYRAAFESDPTAMEALAYDAAALLENLLRSGSSDSREKLRDQLTNSSNFSGVTGKISFQNGQLNRTINILTVKSGKIAEATPK